MAYFSSLLNVIYQNVLSANISIGTFCVIAFLWLALDSMGLPLPYEGMLLITGALVAAGFINPFLAVGLTIFATVLGACISFSIASSLKTLTNRLNPGQKAILNKIMGLMEDEKGFVTLIAVRFIPGIRHFSSYIAGISNISLKTFLLPTAIGSSIWTVFVLAVGFSGMESIKMFRENAMLSSVLLLLIVSIFGYIYISLHKHSKKYLK